MTILGKKSILSIASALVFLGFAACSSRERSPDRAEGEENTPTPLSGGTHKDISWGTPLPDSSFSVDGYPTEVIHKKTGIAMVYVPAGEFWMGSDDSDLQMLKGVYESQVGRYKFVDATIGEQPRHRVILTHGFYLSKYEVANAIYKKWKPQHRSGFSEEPFDWHGPEAWKPENLDGDSQPAIRVSWENASSYCNDNDLRLPTEAEWEYAARGGTLTVYPWGAIPSVGARFCNSADASFLTRGADTNGRPFMRFDDGYAKSAPVGSFAPNAFGLHDMIGNVSEWCSDWFDDKYYGSSEIFIDPKGPSDGQQKTLRGGAWNCDMVGCRSAIRFHESPFYADVDAGFRVAHDL